MQIDLETVARLDMIISALNIISLSNTDFQYFPFSFQNRFSIAKGSLLGWNKGWSVKWRLPMATG